MNTYPMNYVMVAAIVTAIIAMPFGVFTIWLSLKAGDWAQTLSKKFGELFGWMVYLPLCCVALAASVALGTFVFYTTMDFFVS